ncbi:hypothetical protein CHLV3229_03800 [Campylobacter helveticus]|nr:hypothetical protein [Campylobacter helveticus]MCR2065980.1 hypothetical protein [Campylobacter helveticus]
MFFNEILARSEIDVLFCPKALQNFEFIGTPTERTKSRSLKSA